MRPTVLEINEIMDADEVLKNQGGGRTGGRPAGAAAKGGGGRGGGVIFGKGEYFIALLGAPSATSRSPACRA